MSSRLSVFFLLAGVVLSCMAGGNVRAGEDVSSPENKSGNGSCLVDKPIAAFQRELLNLAFDTATAIPKRPHIKDRSKTQEAVVAASLVLEQPRRAHDDLQKIDNWRRGASYADLAAYCARQGMPDAARHYLQFASQMAQNASVEAWRRDRIQSKMATAYLWLNQPQEANHVGVGKAVSDEGKVARVKAMFSDPKAFNKQIEALEALIQTGSFDNTKYALDAYAELYDRFYDGPQRRSQIETKIKASIGKLPVLFRIYLLAGMAESARAHADREKSLEMLHEAQALTDAHQWPPRYGLPLKARLIDLRAQAGDQQKARVDADAALAEFDAVRERMVDIDRAGALRPLAAAYQSIGDTAAALAVYRRAVEEGVVNPNSRPKAEDLSATCVSMALHGVEPDVALWTRMRQIHGALGAPW